MSVLKSRAFKRGVVIVAVGLLALVLVDAARYVRAFDASVEELIARSQFIRENARPTYEEEVLAGLGENRYNSSVLRLDEMLGQAVVLEEPAAVDVDSSIMFAFEFDPADPVGIESGRGESALRFADGLVIVTQRRDDYLTNTTPLQIPRDEVGTIVVRARAGQPGRMTVGWSKEVDPEDVWRNKLSIDLVGDSSFHIYEIDAKNALKRGLSSGEALRSLFIQPTSRDSARVEIDFVRFVSKRSRYMVDMRGTDHETIGLEMRRVLYMVPPHAVQYSLAVPGDAPTLRFGAATLVDGRRVTFSVDIASGGRRQRLYENSLQSSEAWRDVEIDLSRWAGETVQLTLAARGGRNNVALWSNPVVSPRPTDRFNVIVILEDALRSDHLSTYGYERPTAPVKDSLMREAGVVFTSAISQATKTRPSVPSMMTSLLPTHTGVWSWSDALRDEYLTLAEIMRAQGFETASFVQNGNAGPAAGLHQGFSVLLDAESIGQSTEALLDHHLSEWLRRNRDRNFFLYLHLADPHGVYDPPAPFDGWYHESAAELRTPVEPMYLDPPWVEQPTTEGRNLLYDGEIRHNDAVMRDFLARVDSLGILDHTLLIFVADHGEYLGEHGLWEHHPPGHLQVIGVPLMLRYPARFTQPQRIPQMVQLMDVMPTILELAGVETFELLMAGSSLVDLIEGRRLAEWEDRVTVSEEPMVMSKDAPCSCGSLFFRQWHLIASPFFSGVPRMLDRRAFNYRADPSESRASLSPVGNLLAWYKHARIIPQLQQNNMEAWRRWTGGGVDEVLKLDPETLERLRGLGYINN